MPGSPIARWGVRAKSSSTGTIPGTTSAGGFDPGRPTVLDLRLRQLRRLGRGHDPMLPNLYCAQNLCARLLDVAAGVHLSGRRPMAMTPRSL